MIITLIGMSNVGKTTMAKRIERELGYLRFSVDDMIQERLAYVLAQHGPGNTSDVAAWMGQPYHEQYTKTSKMYITAERRCMQAIFKHIRAQKPDGRNIVIDTTGSVIYTGKTILNLMRQLSKVIYLESNEEGIELLFQRFISNPKPLIWGDCYRREAHQDAFEALKICYRDLLRWRDEQYRNTANSIVPFATVRDPAFTPSSLLAYAA